MIKECKKVKYATEQVALFYVKKLQKTSNRKNIPIRAYLCPYCTTWHLTSRESIESQKLVEREQQIKLLQEELRQKNVEINILNGKENKEANVKIKTDDRILALNKQINAQRVEIRKSRDSNRELIMKILRLERQLEHKNG